MASHIVENLKREIENFKADIKAEKVGKVVEVFDGIAKVSGLSEVKSQEMLKFEGGEAGVAFNLEEDTVGVIVLDDFSKINEEFSFSAEIPKELEVEYIPQLKAINIYTPTLQGDDNIEKSQLYISFFKASKFLTLSTVDITKQDKMIIKVYEAILYEITKKDGVPNFLGQPNWRNFKHQALDIRLTKDSPSYFYSFAYTPDLEEKVFNDIIDSIVMK